MINNNRIIENAYNMLQYLYEELRGKRFKNIDITSIETLNDLYGLIISRWCASIAKEGLYKEYVEVIGDEMTSPRGQIDIQESISKQTRLRGTLICNYDELSENIYINHILKGTLQYLLFEEDIDKSVKNDIKKTMQLFNGVEYTDINFVQWKTVKFNNNNMRYKHLIEVCKTLVFENKLEKAKEIDDNKRLFLLFKKQITKYYRLNYTDDIVEVVEKPYTMIENEPHFEVNINKVQKLIVIRNEKMALMCCVRLIDEHIMDDNRLPKKQMSELVKYMRDFKSEYRIKVAGCLIYINTDRRKLNLQPITVNSINSYMVGETTIDIFDQWRFIANKLDDVYKYFVERDKNRRK
jgi:5-methylcytosine-specific restriction enzyme subunit McrC